MIVVFNHWVLLMSKNPSLLETFHVLPRTRLDDVFVVVEQHGRFVVAPLSPARHCGEHFTRGLDKIRAFDLVERIPKIDLQ